DSDQKFDDQQRAKKGHEGNRSAENLVSLTGYPEHMAESGARVRLTYEIKSALGLAWDSIRAHKLRSFLTLLGVIIGVASVILVGSAIDGLGVYAENITAKAFGSDSFVLQQVTNAKTRTEYFNKLRRNRALKLADERYLEEINSDN